MTDLLAPRRPLPIRFFAIVALFFASFFVVKPIWHSFALSGDARYPVFLIPLLATLLFFAELRRHAARNGRMGPAVSRYMTRLASCMTAYFALLLLANYLTEHNALTGPAAWAIALLPALPILGAIITILRYLAEEEDEYIRLLAVRSSLIATGLTLAVATVWGMLEQAGLAAHFPVSTIFAIWCVGLGVGQMTQKVACA